MPKLSKQTASLVEDFGVAEDRHDDLDGYTVNFVTIRQDHDLAPMLSGLPGGNCPCLDEANWRPWNTVIQPNAHRRMICVSDQQGVRFP